MSEQKPPQVWENPSLTIRYRKIREIAKGRTATIHLAEATFGTVRKLVAVKEFPPKGDPLAWLNEALVLVRTRSPYVVDSLDACANPTTGG